VARLIFAMVLAATLLAAGQASAGGYYPGGYDDHYHDGYYGSRYYGYDEPYGAYRYYWGPIPIISPIITSVFGPGPRCQHRVPVMNYQGELRGGWVNGC
jgi:hypothetical protein